MTLSLRDAASGVLADYDERVGLYGEAERKPNRELVMERLRAAIASDSAKEAAVRELIRALDALLGRIHNEGVGTSWAPVRDAHEALAAARAAGLEVP